MLKKKLGDHVVPSPSLPLSNSHGQFLVEPTAVLDRRLVKKGGKAVVQVKIQWMNMSAKEATWEDYDQMLQQFPNFDP